MITFRFNGISLTAPEGQSVAAALIAHQERIARYTRHAGKPRALFCGIGVCFDCLLIIDGMKNQRSCITVVRDGMIVEVQHGS